MFKTYTSGKKMTFISKNLQHLDKQKYARLRRP